LLRFIDLQHKDWHFGACAYFAYGSIYLIVWLSAVEQLKATFHNYQYFNMISLNSWF